MLHLAEQLIVGENGTRRLPFLFETKNTFCVFAKHF